MSGTIPIESFTQEILDVASDVAAAILDAEQDENLGVAATVVIARAILAERKRCAALARAKAAEWRAFGNGLRENSADGRTDGADRQMQAQAAAADWFARAIEEGRQP